MPIVSCLMNRIICALLLLGFGVGANAKEVGKSSPDKKFKTNKTVKMGNVIGHKTTEINLTVLGAGIKIKRVKVICDGMKERICYEKKGEDSVPDDNNSNFVGWRVHVILGNGHSFIGTQVRRDIEYDHMDGGSTNIMFISADDYFEL